MDRDAPDNDDQQFSGRDTATELQAMKDEKETPEARREVAWHEYKGYDNPDYQTANAERAASGKIRVDRYPNATIVAQINVDESGRTIDGHDYNPEAQSHRDTERAFADYLERTKDHPEDRLVIIEGDVQDLPGDRRAAIEARSDAGLVMSLAKEDGVEIVSADPSREEQNAYLEQHGVDAIDRALSSMVSRLTVALEQNPDGDLAMEAYGQLALNGIKGFQRFTPEEQAKISANPGGVEGLRQQAIRVMMEEFNPRLAQQDAPQFTADESGQYHLPGATPESLWKMVGPDGEGRLGDTARMKLEFRDRHIFDTVTGAVDDGREPFMIFGGSHVVALEPALSAYFGAPER